MRTPANTPNTTAARARNAGTDADPTVIARPVRVDLDAGGGGGVAASVVAVDSVPVPTADRDVISAPALVDGVQEGRGDPVVVAVDSVGIPPRPVRAVIQVAPGMDVVPIVARLPSH